MKELSIEEKAKRYDKALEKSKKLYEQGTITESLAYIFPELKESEEEKTRKEIVEFLKKNLHLDWAIWLEKQGEQKSADKVEPTAWSEDDENRINRLIAYFEDKESFTAEDDVVYANWLKSLKDRVQPQTAWKPSDEHYELEEFAKIVRGNLTDISKAAQELFEAKYLQLTGNKMYGGYKD